MKGSVLSMKAILYYVILMDDERDKRRQKQLENFLNKYNIEIINTYYDVNFYDQKKKRLGLYQLLEDLTSDKVNADAFICMSVHDMGRRKFLIKTLTEINSYVPMIYFADIETNDSDDIA